MEPERTEETARQTEEILYRCPACGAENTFDSERFDLDAPHCCAACGRPVFGPQPEEEPQ